ncbi:hypothetical protein [Tellurirhabdus rosea]|uniref:hypothetical protein n=1 Tax=Tellurirhabdus rosea TaxID=2674997 RepID=UPI00225077AE|nr:hypothetical protein [Tellurirhabdus rosea]
MKQRPSDIIRYLSLFLTGLLLLLAAGGPALTGAGAVAKPVVAKEQKAGKPVQMPETIVKGASFEAVVTPAASFDFAQAVYLLPPVVQLLVPEQPKITRAFEVPYFYFSYFRHVFGHHIAANAP